MINNGVYNPYDQMNASSPYISGYRGYGNYNPYQSMMNNQNQSQNQMIPQNMQMQTQPTTNNIQFVLVPNIDVAEKATVEKNQTIYMMNQNKPEIYAKAADSFGLQNTRYFKLVEFDPSIEMQSQQIQQQNVDYIPRDEFNKFVAFVSSEIETIKNNTSSIENPVTSKNSSSGSNKNKKEQDKD